MTEQEADAAWEAQEKFFEDLRNLYRKLKEDLTEEQMEYIFDGIHHVVNLYNPYIAS